MWSILKAIRENPELLRESQRKRGEPEELVDKAVELDKKWRRKLKEVEELRRERNKLSEKIAKAEKEEREELVRKAKEISQRLKIEEEELRKLKEEREKVLLSFPNILDPEVPPGKDESENLPIRFFGKAKVVREDEEKFLQQSLRRMEYQLIEKRPLGHADFVEINNLADIQRAAKVSGARFYYLLNQLVWLDFALIQYALEFLAGRGFKIVCPPYLMKKEAYEKVTSVTDFEDDIYKVEGEDLYLIATSEHAIAAMHMNEVLEEKRLPLLYAGVSPCFRKEAGVHGKDTKGIFRVHQFHKVEQFVFCLPEESGEWHEKLINNAEALFRGLGIPYRIVNICSGDLGAVASKKYDLEGWFPNQGRFRELVSCSNCTDWQSYRLNIRYAEKPGLPSKGFVHTLNSTAIATQRAICAIIENYQIDEKSFEIPKVLRKYLENIESAPKDKISL